MVKRQFTQNINYSCYHYCSSNISGEEAMGTEQVVVDAILSLVGNKIKLDDATKGIIKDLTSEAMKGTITKDNLADVVASALKAKGIDVKPKDVKELVGQVSNFTDVALKLKSQKDDLNNINKRLLNILTAAEKSNDFIGLDSQVTYQIEALHEYLIRLKLEGKLTYRDETLKKLENYYRSIFAKKTVDFNKYEALKNISTYVNQVRTLVGDTHV